MTRAAFAIAAMLLALGVQAQGLRDPAWPELSGGPAAHHPVGRPLPGTFADARFNQPGGRSDDLWFFDTNQNGTVDDDEVRFFGPERRVECGSCHGEPPPGTPPSRAFLRVDNRDSRLCLICHRI